ncbi:hypothetical protein HPP92_000526 [Vanilla planifolia]|uniref:Uncharacterized protein n=1 Tax=Vanilla planifolia TaxID=51239 RepID=A0A835VH44_VANPL|nr:hypothetical protein HPP92_000526 [Vanilla planifolia]
MATEADTSCALHEEGRTSSDCLYRCCRRNHHQRRYRQLQVACECCGMQEQCTAEFIAGKRWIHTLPSANSSTAAPPGSTQRDIAWKSS